MQKTFTTEFMSAMSDIASRRMAAYDARMAHMRGRFEKEILRVVDGKTNDAQIRLSFIRSSREQPYPVPKISDRDDDGSVFDPRIFEILVEEYTPILIEKGFAVDEHGMKLADYNRYVRVRWIPPPDEMR